MNLGSYFTRIIREKYENGIVVQAFREIPDYKTYMLNQVQHNA